MIRLVIVDDHDVVRHGIRSLFDSFSGFRVSGEAKTLAGAEDIVGATHPDVVLLDVRLPDSDDGRGAARLKARSPRTRVLVLSAFGDPATVRAALAAGADAFLVKDADGSAIREAVLAVHYGDRVMPAESITEPDADRNPLANERSPLSPREREVLQLLAEGYQNKEIAGFLNLAEKSVRNIVTRLLRKLRVSNRTEAALKARDILPSL